jgi:hypothetical protein
MGGGATRIGSHGETAGQAGCMSKGEVGWLVYAILFQKHLVMALTWSIVWPEVCGCKIFLKL